MSASEKVAIITGAGTGIGKHTTLAFLREGYSVALAGRREEPLKTTVEEAGVEAAKTLVVPTDVSDPASVQNLFAQTKEKFGRLDVLFNNAGIGAPRANLEDLTYEGWQNVVNINLTGVFLCIQEAFKIMKDQDPRGGRIINNGSVSAHVPRPNSAPYTATKHAVTGLTKSASLDGRKYDIAVGQIDIGNAVTELSSGIQKGVPQANGSVEVEPMMNVENVAQAVLHMASLPLDANIPFLTITATKMPYIGRG
ncbi:MAG: SDR family oxidoreductase [Candidatus Latescibacteria bacterium]|jgi:NAD(P)-dependent dehydrogenase (short-subunit alcohol dehydrogenase family)|nr:SDR family oxidoreductase [Candidatus Latescibacterota bacterium]